MFTGKFEDIIPLNKYEQQEAISQLKDFIEAGEAHQYKNFEIVLLKTLEVQLQEIEHFNGKLQGESVIREMLLQEIEQLQAQSAVMREALESILRTIEMQKLPLVPTCDMLWITAIETTCEKVLSTDSGKDYHNPADVEALKKAQEVLKALDVRGGLGYDKHAWIRDALEVIEKVLGGKEDGI